MVSVTGIWIKGVSRLGDRAFQGFSNMEFISFDSCIQSIGSLALDGCTALDTLIFEGDPPVLGRDAFPKQEYSIIHPYDSFLWNKPVKDRFSSGEPTPATPSVSCGLTPQEVYDTLIALKARYPHGMRWTNEDGYSWNGGYFTEGLGCAGFSFLLSDAVFKDEPAVCISENITIDTIRPGDILRLKNPQHSVVALEVHENYIVLAEGNFNSSIYWGRTMSAQEIASRADYLLTRYPSHTWADATCEEPGICSYCGQVGDEPLGHDYRDGICSLCGEAELEAIVWGDANNSGDVDYLDAMLVLRHAVKLITLEKDVADRCDVNRSGDVDYLDAMLILRFAVKLLDKLPIGK